MRNLGRKQIVTFVAASVLALGAVAAYAQSRGGGGGGGGGGGMMGGGGGMRGGGGGGGGGGWHGGGNGGGSWNGGGSGWHGGGSSGWHGGELWVAWRLERVSRRLLEFRLVRRTLVRSRLLFRLSRIVVVARLLPVLGRLRLSGCISRITPQRRPTIPASSTSSAIKSREATRPGHRALRCSRWIRGRPSPSSRTTASTPPGTTRKFRSARADG